MEHRCNKEGEIATLLTNVEYIKEKLDSSFTGVNKKIDSLIIEVDKNTKFRQQAKGIFGGIAFVCTMFGSAIYFVAEKFIGGR